MVCCTSPPSESSYSSAVKLQLHLNVKKFTDLNRRYRVRADSLGNSCRTSRHALSAAERALAMSGRHCWALVILSSIYGAWGKADSARTVYQEMEVRRVREYIQPAMLSIAAAAVREVDRAIEFAQEAVDERTRCSSWLHDRGPSMIGCELIRVF